MEEAGGRNDMVEMDKNMALEFGWENVGLF